MHRIVVLSALIGLVGAESSAWAQLEGRVQWDGPPPERKGVDLIADPLCAQVAAGMKEEQFVVQDGGLANAFVFIKNPPKKRYTPRNQPVIDQAACRFVPRVIGVMVGQKLEVLNSDETLHNVRGADGSDKFNRPMPRKGQRIFRRFKTPKVMVTLRCDLHPWMRGYVGVMQHPFFAVTDEKGKFQIDTAELPDGTYALTVWHEILGEKTATIKIEQGKGTETVIWQPKRLPTLRPKETPSSSK